MGENELPISPTEEVEQPEGEPEKKTGGSVRNEEDEDVGRQVVLRRRRKSKFTRKVTPLRTTPFPRRLRSNPKPKQYSSSF